MLYKVEIAQLARQVWPSATRFHLDGIAVKSVEKADDEVWFITQI